MLSRKTLRFFGPGIGTMMRNSIKEHFLGGVPISKDTNVTIDNITNNYNEKYYKNPFVYQPERWIL